MRPPSGRLTTVGKWLFAVLVPASALAVGSLHPVATCLLAVVAALSAIALWWGASVRLPTLAQCVLGAIGLLSIATALQLVPLPSGMLHAVSPATFDIWDRALSPMREPGPGLQTLSVAPTATAIDLVRLLAYGCTFLAAVRIANLHDGYSFLVRVVVASTSLMAMAALAHWAVSASTVFGVYRPQETWAYRPGRLAPLLNTNHLAAYLNIGACVSFAALLAKRWMPRALSGSAAILTTATSILVSSRGATTSLVFGLALVGGLSFYARGKFRTVRAEVVVTAACILAATVVCAVALSDTREHLVSRDLSKVEAVRRSWLLVREAPWLGYGRGSFETIFASVLDTPTYMVWTHPENFVAQCFVEWGIPVSLAAFGLFGWAFRPQVLFRAVTPPIGAWCALAATMLHELVDYHLETPGVAVLAITCAALVVSGSRSSSSSTQGSRVHRGGPRLSLAFGAAAVVAVLVSLPSVGHTLSDERRDLSRAALDPALSTESFQKTIRASMLRYPAEPFIPLMGAVHAQRFGEPGVLAWVERALERNPKFGRAHLVLARFLASGHAAQARLEYRLACDYDTVLRDACVREGNRLVDDTSSALELVPEDPAAGAVVLEALAGALAPRLPSTAWQLDVELARRFPTSSAPLARRATAFVTDALDVEPWCRNTECVDSARRELDAWKQREPDRCGPERERARLDVVFGEADAALGRLQEASRNVTDKGACTKALVELAMERRDTRRADAALDEIAKGNCTTHDECIDLCTWAARLLEGRREYVRAVAFWRRASELAPEDDAALLHLADLGEKAGLISVSLDAYRVLGTRHPTDPEWDRRAADLRKKALDRALGPL